MGTVHPLRFSSSRKTSDSAPFLGSLRTLRHVSNVFLLIAVCVSPLPMLAHPVPFLPSHTRALCCRPVPNSNSLSRMGRILAVWTLGGNWAMDFCSVLPTTMQSGGTGSSKEGGGEKSGGEAGGWKHQNRNKNRVTVQCSGKTARKRCREGGERLPPVPGRLPPTANEPTLEAAARMF